MLLETPRLYPKKTCFALSASDGCGLPLPPVHEQEPTVHGALLKKKVCVTAECPQDLLEKLKDYWSILEKCPSVVR